MKIQDVLKDENIGKKFEIITNKGFKSEYTLTSSLTLVDKFNYPINSTYSILGIVNAEYKEVKEEIKLELEDYKNLFDAIVGNSCPSNYSLENSKDYCGDCEQCWKKAIKNIKKVKDETGEDFDW